MILACPSQAVQSRFISARADAEPRSGRDTEIFSGNNENSTSGKDPSDGGDKIKP
jgi:hypothetical protein